MLPEFLVVLSCLNGSGCEETTSAYRAQNPWVNLSIREAEKELNRIGRPLLVQYWGPALLLAAGKPAVVHLTTQLSISLTPGSQVLFYSGTF